VWFSRASTSASYGDNNGVANAGNIQITTGELLFKDGGNITAFNSGQGNAGNIILDVANTTTFDGFSANTGLPSAANTFAIDGNGNAGNIQLKTGSLFLTNGGLINTSASGTGNSGKITIDARDRISIDGIFINLGKNFNLVSGLASVSLGGGRGQGCFIPQDGGVCQYYEIEIFEQLLWKHDHFDEVC
jgi:large exoprotein involved in heme utilization and adhesion